MTPARCFALAVAFGACCLGAASAQAQLPGPEGLGDYPGPMVVDGPPMSYGDPGFNPYRTPQPMQGVKSGWEIEVPDDGTLLPPPRILSGNGFLRVEYLYYDLAEPGDDIMGAPVQGIADPSQPFVIFSPGTTSPAYYGLVPSTRIFDTRGTNGVKTTIGVELARGGSVELSAFMLAQKKSGFVDRDLGTTFGLQNVYATSVLLDGQIGSTLYVYNAGYAAYFQSQLWGAEANFLADTDVDGLFHFRPMIGARYLQLNERLSQYGTFQELAPVPSFETSIESKASNYLGGGQVGARIEMVTKLFDFGAEAKVLALSNTMYAEVASANLRFAGDPYTKYDDNTTQMAFGLDLTGWGVLHLHPNFDVRVGYNFLYLANVTRPDNNIYYNEQGLANPPAISVKLDRQEFYANGVSLGADLKW